MHHLRLLLLIVSVSVLPAFAYAELPASRPSLFDPARHMYVSEVKVGMKGYGLSVFRGTKIERFEVEVLSVLHDFNPKFDVVLITCKGANLEHTGSIAGMSGSPIFLKDDTGQERMIGAFAYGWPLMKDAVAGVQPIEYMLKIPDEKKDAVAGVQGGKSSAVEAKPAVGQGRSRWRLQEVMLLPGMERAPAAWPFQKLGSLSPNVTLLGNGDESTKLRPLATPLMGAGINGKLLENFAPILSAYGVTPMQAGGAGEDIKKEGSVLKLEPGSTLAVPLLTGDMDLTAIGTCTEVIGQRVYGFGHSFNNEGPINLPMGTGYIHTVIANLNTSFKLGSLTTLQGVLANDQVVGVAGRVGEIAPTVPIQIRVVYTDGSTDQTFNFKAALHPRFTPMLASMALAAATTGAHEFPQYHTLDYDIAVEFDNGQTIKIQNTSVNASPGDIFSEIGGPILAAGENPFGRVLVKNVSGTVKVSEKAREAEVLSVNVPKTKYQPGETVKLFVSYRPFHGAEGILPADFELPRDLADGDYEFHVSDWMTYVQEEQQIKPFRFSAENTKEVFAALQDLASLRHDALYLRLLRRPDGVAIGRTAMPQLPSSRRQVLMGAGLSDVTPYVISTLKTLPTPFVMNGNAQFTIKIDREGKVETGKVHPVGHEAAPAPKAEEAKPKPVKTESTPAPQEEPAK